MSVTIAEIKGDHCGYEETDIEPVFVDLSHWEEGTCITLKQDHDWVDLTPRMIADLIKVLEQHKT